MWKTMDEKTLKAKKVAELREIAKTFGLEGYEKMKKAELVAALMTDGSDENEESAEEVESVQAPVKTDEEPESCEVLGESDAVEKEAQSEAVQEGAETEHAHQNSHNDKHSKQKQKNKTAPDRNDRFETEGILELAEGGFGFLRFNNFLTSEKDIYVAPAQIRRFNLKTGDKIKGICRQPNEGDRFGALLYVVTVNGEEPGAAIKRPDFD